MIKKIEDLNYYELLEVSPQANSTEIHRAYERTRRIYDPNSIALYSLFTPEETAVIHRRIEEAYRTLLYEANRKKYDQELKAMNQMPEPARPQSPVKKYQPLAMQPPLPLEPENPFPGNDPVMELPSAPPPAPPQDQVSPVSPFIAEFTGPVIKVLREHLNLTIRNISDTTKISSRYIELIEEENFSKLPARPYLRGFLMLYAKTLGYDPERLAADYLKRYDAAMNQPKK
jgi:curved DNA-binding protein CbpA